MISFILRRYEGNNIVRVPPEILPYIATYIDTNLLLEESWKYFRKYDTSVL